MAPIKIFGYAANPRTRVALVVAEHEKLNVELVSTEQSKPDEFVKKFPFAKIPALLDGETTVYELIAVCTYLASVNHTLNSSGSLAQTAKNAVGLGGDNLIGSNLQDKAAVLQWVSFINMEFFPKLCAWWRPLKGLDTFNQKQVSDAEAATKVNLQKLDDYLLDRTYLAGERITVADIALTSFLQRGAEFVLTKSLFESYPNVLRHFNTVARQSFYAKHAGQAEPQFIESAIVYKAPPKAEKPKADKPAAAPKADKKKAKKDDDEEEDDVPKEEKPKHPIEALGPAKSFPLDEWKRQYSNLDTPDALKWFAEHFDPQEYSLWRAEYKYPEELTQVFMSANLIGGFHARLEASRKFLFGSMGVYGKANDSVIQGVYLVRGSNGHHAFEVAPDYESYDFTPLEYTNEEHKKIVHDCWLWEGQYKGKDFADGKIFK